MSRGFGNRQAIGAPQGRKRLRFKSLSLAVNLPSDEVWTAQGEQSAGRIQEKAMSQSNSANPVKKVVFAHGASGLMKVSFRERGNTRIVDVAGGVDLKASPLLRQLLFEAIGEAPKVALNLAAISFIDSSGIAVLLEALLESQRRHGQFVLFGMNPTVRDDFRITHVAKVFQVADSEEQALAKWG